MTENVVIEAGQTERHYWRDLWTYRELFYILSWRDIKVRYKQTVIGASWAVIRPLLTMIIFTVLFNIVGKVPPGVKAPYALMVYAGLLPWTFFATALSESSNSLITNSNLISKVYFPRMIVPTASVITSLVDFVISFVLIFALYAYYKYLPDWHIFIMPFFLILAFISSIGVGLFVTALNVKYRDFRYIVPFIVQFGMYVSPVVINTSLVPERWKYPFALNPMVGVIDGFRWCLLRGSQELRWDLIAISSSVSFFFLWLGVRQFRNMEKSFADII
jgi:lipopolysaccharide transport system permease protein